MTQFLEGFLQAMFAGLLIGAVYAGPIPNPVVKDVSADGTWRATSRESRSMPRGFFYLKFYPLN